MERARAGALRAVGLGGAESNFSFYLAAASLFAAAGARGFLIPLQANELGAGRYEVGLLFTVFTISAALFSIPAGLLADRIGRRNTLLIAVSIGAVSQVGMGLSRSVAVFFAWQILAGIGVAGAQAAVFSAVTDAAGGARLGRAWGWLTLSMQVGFFSGPALAGISLRFLDLGQAMLLATALFLLPLAAAVAGNWQSRQQPVRRRGLGEPLRGLLGHPAFPAAALAIFAITMLWGTVQGYLPLFAKQSLGLPSSQIGYMIALIAVANGLSRIPAGRLVDRLQRGPLVGAVGLGIFAAAMAALPHLGGFWAPTLLFAATIPALATAMIAINVTLIALAPPDARGAAVGLYGVALFLGFGAGPAIFGPFIERQGYVVGFTIAAATSLGLMLVSLLLRMRTTKPDSPPLDGGLPRPSGRVEGAVDQP